MAAAGLRAQCLCSVLLSRGQRGRGVLCYDDVGAAHGNSLRGLVKHLDKMSDAAVLELNIPTGVPLIYELDEDLQPVKHYYLMDEKELKVGETLTRTC